jgi:hypothetical protein
MRAVFFVNVPLFFRKSKELYVRKGYTGPVHFKIKFTSSAGSQGHSDFFHEIPSS